MISKLSIIVLLIFLITCTINAQQKDSIIVDYTFWGNDFYVGGKEYSRSEIKDTLKNNRLTSEQIHSSNSDKIWGYVCLSTGILLTGYSVYQFEKWYSSSGDRYANKVEVSSWALPSTLAICLDITGIILLVDSNDSYNQNINLYNQNLPPKNQASGYELDLKCDLNRITLTLKF